MNIANIQPLVAVDIGNSRIKLGLFDRPLAPGLPIPLRSLAVGHDWKEPELLAGLGENLQQASWSIASVHRPAGSRLCQWLEHLKVDAQVLEHGDLPLEVALDAPERVGIDRLADAVAANRLRRADTPAVIIDFGSAMTIDMVDRQGRFVGGAIAPGLEMSARALHEFTDLLPKITVEARPEALGITTSGAMQSGLYWGAVGAVRELVSRLSRNSSCDVFTTGGILPALVETLQADIPNLRHIPHLTLAGIALASDKTVRGGG